MKAVKTNKYLNIIKQGIDGGIGYIKLPRQNLSGYTKASIIWSNGGGWEHVSVCPLNGSMPKWEDMCFVRKMFFDDEDWVVEFHPPKSEYVNNMPNCLHLWKPLDEKLPTPPSILTGLKGIEFDKALKAKRRK